LTLEDSGLQDQIIIRRGLTKNVKPRETFEFLIATFDVITLINETLVPTN
jgi:hypothetical protein